jgi:hypothetical protein
MQLVALTRWNPGRDPVRELPVLAQCMGVMACDARLKLASPLPIVIGSGVATEVAQQRLQLLRSLGHGAVACDADALFASAEMIGLRGFSLHDSGLLGLDLQRRSVELPNARLRGIVRAVELSHETQTLETKDKKLAIGRAVLTGGVLLNKTIVKRQTNAASERQRVAYLFYSEPASAVLLKENALSYEGLRELRGVTAQQSFDALLAWLTTNAPSALNDNSLLARKRPADLTSVRGIAAERVVSSSNAAANALAAQLVMLAHEQRQL